MMEMVPPKHQPTHHWTHTNTHTHSHTHTDINTHTHSHSLTHSLSGHLVLTDFGFAVCAKVRGGRRREEEGVGEGSEGSGR